LTIGGSAEALDHLGAPQVTRRQGQRSAADLDEVSNEVLRASLPR
jgi:hypothetical protein